MSTLLIPVLLASTLNATPMTVIALAEDTARPAAEQHPVKDAVIKSAIVGNYAVNPHVSMLKLDVKVENGVVWLGGTAQSSTERDLAVEIAKGTDGVREVHSDVAIAGEPARHSKQRRTVGETIDDATLTARVKSKLISNENTPGGRINVTTKNSVVTLTGSVDTDAQRDLAGHLAENTEHVASVRNDITVSPR